MISEPGRMQFNPEIEVVLDTETFESRLDQFERQFQSNRLAAPVSELMAIVDSYRGALLAGHYDEWVAGHGELLRSRYRAALAQLVELLSKSGDHVTALRYALILVGEEPLDEEAQRQVLRLYAMNLQPSAADRHYQQFARYLDEQLKAKPSVETTRLIQRIQADAASSPVGFAEGEPGSAAFVGRRSERSTVLNRVIELTAGKGGVVLIEGEPGIGKSRLAEELVSGAEWRGANVLVGHHSETSNLTPYEGLKAALEPAMSGLRLDHVVGTVEPLWLQQASLILDGLAGLVPTGARSEKLRPADETWRMAEALAQIILALGQPKPTVLVLEDVHYCDVGTMAVLSQLGERLLDSEVLICLTYQLHEAKGSPAIWDGLSAIEAEPGSTRVVVPPLGDDEVRELVTAELGPGRMSAPAIEQLVSSTAGNPYMVLELLRSPLELLTGGQHEEAPNVGDPGRIDDFLLPKLAEIISLRIDSTSGVVRSVIESVSVLGVAASSGVVASIADISKEAAIEALQKGIDLGFLVESDSGCDFVQAQTRRVVYESMDVQRRRELHGKIADTLTRLDGVNVEQIAHHAWAAAQWPRAYQYYALASDSALKLNAYETAVDHFLKADHAAAAVGLSDLGRIDDLLEYERVLHVLGRRDQQRNLLERLANLEGADSTVELTLRERRCWLLIQTDGSGEAARVAEEGLQLARANGQNVGELLTIIGTASSRTGEPQKAIESLKQAIVELRAEGHSVVTAQLTLGRTYAELQDFDAAHRQLEEAFGEAKEIDDPTSQVEALGHMAALWVREGSEFKAVAAFQEALTLARSIGYRDGEGKNLLNLAVLHVLNARSGRALGLFSEAGEVFASLRDKRGGAFVKANTAWLLHWFIGDDQAAVSHAESAAVELRRHQDVRAEAVCLNIIAGCDRRAGRRRRARHRLGLALKKTRSADDHDTQVETLIGLTLVEIDLDRYPAALEQVDAANELRRVKGLQNLAPVVLALEAKVRMGLGQVDEALKLTERVISTNRPEINLAHLAAWWCAEVLREAGSDEAAAEQVAFAHKLLVESLKGVSAAMAEQAWQQVPEHKAIMLAREQYFVESIQLQLPSTDTPTGRPLVPSDFVDVRWTRSHPDDWEIESSAERRRHRVLRLASEASAQGGAARQIDLANVLDVSERTIKRDLAILRSKGFQPVTRRGPGENI